MSNDQDDFQNFVFAQSNEFPLDTAPKKTQGFRHKQQPWNTDIVWSRNAQGTSIPWIPNSAQQKQPATYSSSLPQKAAFPSAPLKQPTANSSSLPQKAAFTSGPLKQPTVNSVLTAGTSRFSQNGSDIPQKKPKAENQKANSIPTEKCAEIIAESIHDILNNAVIPGLKSLCMKLVDAADMQELKFAIKHLLLENLKNEPKTVVREEDINVEAYNELEKMAREFLQNNQCGYVDVNGKFQIQSPFNGIGLDQALQQDDQESIDNMYTCLSDDED